MTGKTKAEGAALAAPEAAKPAYRRADGDVLDLPAPDGGVEANRFYSVGDLVVFAAASAKAGVPFQAFPRGVYADAPKATGKSWTAGQALFFADGAFTTSGAGAPVAHAARDAKAGDAAGWVRLRN